MGGIVVVIGITAVTLIGLATLGFIKIGQAWGELYGVDERGYK